MRKLILNQKVKEVIKRLKSWGAILLFVVILRYTGLLSGLSVLAQSALISTGVMDIQPDQNAVPAQPFNYNFTIADLNGQEVDVSEFKGKVIFLNLWATWCGPCRAEMPSIQKLYDNVDHDKIVFVMLSLDTEENKGKIGRYIKDQGFSFPVYRPNSAMPNQLRVSTIPTTFIVGTDGKIKMKKSGAANYDTEEFQKFLLEESAAEAKK
jgi:thiol-disulfide isomerase/thioredoxin